MSSGNLGYESFESRWLDHPDMKKKVRELCEGKTLNFPCGQNDIGDVRADIDESHNPDVIADLENSLKTFDEQSFDTVYCDPPYSMFDFGESTAWVQDLYKIARKRLIIQGVNKALYPGGPASEELYCLKPKPGSTKHWIRVLHVFTRPDTNLADYK